MWRDLCHRHTPLQLGWGPGEDRLREPQPFALLPCLAVADS